MASITEPTDLRALLLANLPDPQVDPDTLEAFISRWKDAGGTERANYQLFLNELCEVLGLLKPEPARDDQRDNAYVFERRVTEEFVDGGNTKRFIDLYKRSCFVCEAKQSGLALESGRWDKAMRKAFNQAEGYVRALPAVEGRPPFIIVTDVGRHLELYSEFSRSGGNYTAYPDSNNYKIKLEDLRKPEVQQRLIAVWNDPMELDPSRVSARVTRQIADKLAELAKSLEAANHTPEQTSGFLMRCLFTMFAEDVGLLPHRSFTELLIRLEDHKAFAPMLESLWQTMNTGGFSPILEDKVLKFNGGLFSDAEAIELNRDQRLLLIEAAKCDWRFVEPAIFGTLLERALDPRERHKLGAHYTPRSYVERLVMPTIIEPLREEWENVQAAAVSLESKGKHSNAVAEIRAFHLRLCNVRVLDPACGSGNFLYVTLEHMKRLEGDVLNVLHELGESQGLLDMEGITVDPHQFLGIEINPRAAKVAEMVLWIGYLQWHFRTYGNTNPPEPVLRDFHNIENRDALIDYDSRSELLDENGQSATIWDGLTMKLSPVTGGLIPDESARIPVYQYHNPKQSDWPEADFIVGNPPFIGEKRMRQALGDGYVGALRDTYSSLPACDLVMYWWHVAAERVRTGISKRFGFITTNSVTQLKNRQVIEPHLSSNLHITFAIPDHPWIDAGDGAAVRIAMTVAAVEAENGSLLLVAEENDSGEDAKNISFTQHSGQIHANLRVGAALSKAITLSSNSSVVFQGVKLVGNGFLLDETQRNSWISVTPLWERYLPRLIAGADLTKGREARYCIDFFGLTCEQAAAACPPAYQQVLTEVKPMRDNNNDRFFREYWWLFGRARGDMRAALSGLDRYIITSEVSKHRFFTFASTQRTIADGSLAVVASESASYLGILSSRIHVLWALSQGGRMGVGNDARWQNGPCFENYPFPDTSIKQQQTISALAEHIDSHRKRQQAAHDNLTLTGMYNVLEKLRKQEPLTSKEKSIYDDGLIGILRELHDDLDRAVLDSYGWNDLADKLVGLPGATTPYQEKPEAQTEAEEELLKRLVALNHKRAAEETQGKIRWLRPDYQNPDYGKEGASTYDSVQLEANVTVTPKATKAKKLTWPKIMPEQIASVKDALQKGHYTAEAITALYKSPKTTLPKVQEALESLASLGLVTHSVDQYQLVS
ncbi:class I SAM-dependent DNA methyltransferase [Marinobacterium jannaschii]|uniref:class I SAM-dependent DNA methyltransferase n=1 Tax=Marinobacterium jannaschii TaxID=64970 RepID=UPI000A7B6451|nr:class I SAM-dependent DNA methyltransferase [Marinobacterium jannaschii]